MFCFIIINQQGFKKDKSLYKIHATLGQLFGYKKINIYAQKRIPKVQDFFVNKSSEENFHEIREISKNICNFRDWL